MTSAICTPEDALLKQIEQGQLDRALELLGDFAFSIVLDPAATGLVLRSPQLDQLCQRIGAACLAQTYRPGASLDDEPADVIVLATELHDVGGHSRLVEDLIRVRPGLRHLILLTNAYNSPAAFARDRYERLGARVLLAGSGTPLEKLRWAQSHLAHHPHAQVLVFNHHADAIAIAAIQPGLNREVIFHHHADHQLCLGASLTWPRHLDYAPSFLQGCHQAGLSAELLPLSVPQGRHRAPAAANFLRSGGLRTCTSGTANKFTAPAAHPYWEVLPTLLRADVDTHVHIGPLPQELLATLYEALDRAGVSRQRFVHITWVESLWQALLEQSIDLYIGSFPLGGGRATIEALGAGIPLVTYRNPLVPMLGSCGLGPVDTWNWAQPDELRAILRQATPQELVRRARAGQEHYRTHHAPNVFAAVVRGQTRLEVAATPPQGHDDVVSYLLRAKVRAESFASVLERMAAPHPASPTARASAPDVRLLAFYLPQFHEIPENNAWWGPSFTEWTNVRQAQPLFEGHEQPLVPAELGYYDLSDISVMERQAQLAHEHGIHGFCFYYYWFDGRRLLEKPVDQLLKAQHIDLPFCLCWANENWTRRWDGGEQEVLMAQSYASAQNEQFANDLLPYFADPRYIRVDGKPVLLVYRTDIIPDLAQTVAAWRALWRAAGVGEVYLIAVESFQPINPQAHGFDASCEFPPHQTDFPATTPGKTPNLIADPRARIGDYTKLRDSWLGAPRPDYKRFRGLVPSWDNSARRRKGGATLFVNSTPQAYAQWLEGAIGQTVEEFQGDERLVFINAWNEWAEGCTLEPTQRWGRAYLEATRDVLQRPVKDLRPLSAPYAHWLQIRPDRLSAWPPGPTGARPHLTVALGAGEPAALKRTHASLAAQLRPADRVRMADEAGDWGGPGWTLLLNAGDTLEPDALAQLERLLLETAAGTTRLVYTDHDELDADGTPDTPYFKPDFNHDLLLSYPYMGRALAVRNDWAQVLLAAHGSRSYDLALAYRLALRAAAEGGAAAVRHLAAPLLHLDPAEPTVFCNRSETWQALAEVLGAHLAEHEPGSQLLEGPADGTFHVVPALPRTPLVSIVIPTRDQLPLLSRCIESLLEKTDYPQFEVLVVDNGSETAEAREFLAGLAQLDPTRFRVLDAAGPFNFSRMNNRAVREARGEFVLLLNNDTAALHPEWLTMLVRHALRPGVGIVGARLLYPDGGLQHAGVVLGLRGPAEHPALGTPGGEPGYLLRAQVQQNFSAVTAACLLVSKTIYEEVGGLDEQTFAVSYNDVDFCLKVGATGRRIVWTPLATLVHEGSASQKRSIENIDQARKQIRFTREQGAMYERWPQAIAHDPAYNPNLSLTRRGYEIETNPLLRSDGPKVDGQQRCLVFAGDTMGCGQYRLIQPLRAMRDAGLASGRVCLDTMSPNLVLRNGADTLVVQRYFTDECLDALQALTHLKGVRRIYDADDADAHMPMKNAHRAEAAKDARGRIARAIGLCDRLVTSTEALAQQLKGCNDDIRVVPNRLPPALWGAQPVARDLQAGPRRGKPRVGWAGGVSHQGDLEMVADVIRDLADEVDWIFFGLCPESIRPYVREFYLPVPTLDYPQRLMAQDWDLAIAPLEVNTFNECKSNLKLLEYGWCGLPVVCSDIMPYQGDLPVTRVKNRYKDWRDAIRAHLADLPASRAQGQALQRRVADDWVLTGHHLSHWHAAWTD